MKKTILMLVLAGVALAACEKKDEPYQFKGTEQIYLNGVEQPKFKSTTTQHSLYEILREPELYLNVRFEGETADRYRHFSAEQRDTVNNRLLMFSTDILTEEGELIYDFISSTNMFFYYSTGDTVGYIPQSVIDNAREQIEALYAQERFDEIYELFHTAFTFYTCTGEEYKQIVANGGN